MSRRQQPNDRRNLPNYTVSEAAYWLGLPQNTIRNWLLGKRGMAPLLEVAKRSPLVLSFWNLVECNVLASITRGHGVRLPAIRKAIRYTQRELRKPRPLIEQMFQTDGRHLFVESYGKLICASQDGQLAMRDLLEACLQRIQWDEHGLAARLSPWRRTPQEPRVTCVDPDIAFGQPVLIGTSVPAQSIIDRFQARESMQSMAKDFGVSRDAIEGLVRAFVEKAA